VTAPRGISAWSDRRIGATILDAPAEYDYTPGYYAVFFADPDGLKLEVVHEPALRGRQ